jgi:hypothetical protein
VQFIV